MSSNNVLESPSLRIDERGAISLLTLFFLVFLLGGIAALLGLNFEIRFKEGLQDGSDAVAFSAAVILARGMNLLVLFNQIMMLLVAILVALRLAQTLLIIASIVAAALAWVTFGASLAISATLATTANQFGNAYRTAKPIVFNSLRALEAAQELTKSVTPAAAAADSLFEKENHSWVQGAFALPSTWKLPAEKDEFSVLCGKSSQWVLSLALAPLSSFSSDVGDKAKNGSEEIGKKTSRFLCGNPEKSKNPPTHKQKLELRLPEADAHQYCEQKPASRTCQQALARAEAESPDANTGRCPLSSDCTLSSGYFIRASKARLLCATTKEKVLSYQYQLEQVKIEFIHLDGHWLESKKLLMSPHFITSKNAPCGRRGEVGKDWEKHGERPETSTPVCDNFQASWLAKAGRPGDKMTLRYQQVSRIFSCIVEVKRTIPLAKKEDQLGKEMSKRGPLKLKSKFKLGGADSQVRALVWANRGSPIQPKLFGRSYSEADKETSRFAFSQAEYFFDHDGSLPASEWLWERRWRARMRQIHFADSQKNRDEVKATSTSNTSDSECSEQCASGLSQMQELQELFLH